MSDTTETRSTGGEGVNTDETDRLIASDKVEGTAVYNRDGDRLGSVRNVMINKYSGQVAYAVMSFGGFLGIGEPLCCTGRRRVRTEPDPCPGSRGADVLRASEVQHPVQHLGGDGHLGRLPPVRLEA